jgi:hypothetical protein
VTFSQIKTVGNPATRLDRDRTHRRVNRQYSAGSAELVNRPPRRLGMLCSLQLRIIIVILRSTVKVLS